MSANSFGRILFLSILSAFVVVGLYGSAVFTNLAINGQNDLKSIVREAGNMVKAVGVKPARADGSVPTRMAIKAEPK